MLWKVLGFWLVNVFMIVCMWFGLLKLKFLWFNKFWMIFNIFLLGWVVCNVNYLFIIKLFWYYCVLKLVNNLFWYFNFVLVVVESVVSVLVILFVWL